MDMAEPNEYIDPLYGLIKIEEPYASTMTHPILLKQKQRLSGIKSLGLIYNVFPAGSHAKWEHYLGMYHVAEQIEQGLTKSEKTQLRWLCLIGGFGHLPCTYATASAVFLANRLSSEFKKDFRNILRPLNKYCTSCTDKDLCPNRPLHLTFNEANVNALRGLLSGYKIRQLPIEIDLGDRDSLVMDCICPERKLHRLYRAISRYDYMQRDLYHTGLASFSIRSKEVFRLLGEGVDTLEDSPHMRFLNQLHRYLVDTLYLHPYVACLESLFAKVLAEKLCSNDLKVLDLLESDDNALLKQLDDLVGEGFISNLSQKTPVFTIQRDLSSERFESFDSVKVEADLLGLGSKEYGELITYPHDHGLILSTYNMGISEDLNITQRVMLNILSENRELYPIAIIALNLQMHLQHRINVVMKLGQEILSYLFGQARINYNIETVQSTLFDVTNHLKRGEINQIIWELESILREYTIEESFPVRLASFWRRLQHPSRRRTHKLTDEETYRFWRIMVLGLLDLTPSDKGLKNMWAPILNKIRSLIQNNHENKGVLIETLSYLTELTGSRRGKDVIWVFPSVNIDLPSNSSKPKHREVDVVSLSLLKNKVEIALIECTESGSTKKATSDYNKILGLKDYLNSRGFSDLTVRTEVYGDASIQKDFISITNLCQQP